MNPEHNTTASEQQSQISTAGGSPSPSQTIINWEDVARHTDRDYDGLPDYIDSQYNAPDDLYADTENKRYKKVSTAELAQLEEAAADYNTPQKTKSEGFIIKYNSNQENKISGIIQQTRGAEIGNKK